MESQNSDAAHVADNEDNGAQNLEKNNIILREGNVAYEIDRPLFNTDASIDLTALKTEFMQKICDIPEEEAKSTLPRIRFLTDKSEEID